MSVFKKCITYENLIHLRDLIEKGDLQSLMRIIDKYQISEKDKLSLLQLAAREKQVDIVKLLIAKGFKVITDINLVNLYSLDETLLHSVVYSGSLELTEILLDKGASIEIPDYSNATPLIVAAIEKMYPIVDLMLPRVSLKNWNNFHGFSHMHIACMRNQVSIVKKFLQNGAGKNDSVKIDSEFWPGYTALHFAVKFQCVETVEFLLNCGVDITIKDAKKQTPLHIAYVIQNEQIIDLILSAHIGEPKNPMNSDKLSHFDIACIRNNLQIANYFVTLIEPWYSYDLTSSELKSQADNAIFSPLYFAIKHECVDIVKLLLNHIDSSFLSRSIEHTAFANLASETSNKEIIKLINNKLNCKDYNIKVNENLLAFHKALSIKDHEIIDDVMPEIENLEIIDDTLENEDHDIINNILEEEDIDNLMNSNWNIFWPGCTAMHLAVHYNNPKAVEILIKKGADIAVQDFKGKTPLHLAFESDQREMVNLILSQASLKHNPTNDLGLSHFHISCTTHNSVIIENYLKNGVDVNERVKLDSPFWPGYTALNFAVKYEIPEVVELLINNNADITLKNGLDLTLIDEILKSENWLNNYQILESLLLERERKNLNFLPDRGITLLHTACMKNDIELIKNRLDPVNLNTPVNPISPLWAGFTPLHIAVYLESSEATSLLVKSGANLSAKDAYGYTPLYWDIEQREDINVDLISEDNNPFMENGLSVFHIVCRNGINNLEAVNRFCEVGVDANVRVMQGFEDSGKTPLHLTDSVEVTRLLLDYGADVNARDDDWQTPLHSHCTSWSYDNLAIIVEMLLEAYGVEVDALDRFGRTPLILAVLFDDPQSVVALLKHGADINAAAGDGKVALDTDNLIKEIKMILLKQVRKLMIMGLKVSEENVRAYEREKNNVPEFDERQFDIECNLEIDNMRSIKINSSTTLRDIVLKNADEMTKYGENRTLKDILRSGDIDTRFPIYGYLLKL